MKVSQSQRMNLRGAAGKPPAARMKVIKSDLDLREYKYVKVRCIVAKLARKEWCTCPTSTHLSRLPDPIESTHIAHQRERMQSA